MKKGILMLVVLLSCGIGHTLESTAASDAHDVSSESTAPVYNKEVRSIIKEDIAYYRMTGEVTVLLKQVVERLVKKSGHSYDDVIQGLSK